MFRTPIRRLIPLAAAALAAGCALYSDVSVLPLRIDPSKIDRGADLPQMVRKHDYLRAIELAPAVQARERRNATDLASLGDAHLAAGRYDLARRFLRAALEAGPRRETYADVAWSLSQVEYLQNNYAPSYEWAQEASQRGLIVRQWHLDYLEALSNVDAYRFSGSPIGTLHMNMGRPDVPRIDVRVNGKEAMGIIDSGAVLSIASRRLADQLPIRRLGTFKGEFFGLLGEPITVDFGVIERLELGDLVVENVPVAIMPDEKMRFLVTGRKHFDMDFLLGANLLKEFRIELDYVNERVSFTRLMPRDRQPDPAQNLFMDGFRPHVRGTINKRGWYLFVLDTGSEVTFLNDAPLRNAPVLNFGPRFHGATMQGLGGAKKSGEKLEQVEIGIDKWAGTFKTLPMYESDTDERASGIIGQNYLKNFNVVIDFGRMRVELERPSGVR